MFSSLSNETLEFLPIPFLRERVEVWFKDNDYSKALPILGFVGDRHIASASLSFSELAIYQYRAEFGITVHDDYQNQELNTILTKYMINIARSLGLERIDLMVVAHNERAINVYKKLGYKKEGHLRMTHYNNILGDYCDEYKMGLILED